MKLSELIKETREGQCRTVMDVALEAGLSTAYISDIENGKKRPLKANTLKKISDSLGIPYREIKSSVLESVSEDLGE